MSGTIDDTGKRRAYVPETHEVVYPRAVKSSNGHFMYKTTKVVITEFGDESKLAVVEADIAEPAAGEVQVAVEYSVVSGSDVNMRRGTYPFQKQAPLTPGYSVMARCASTARAAPNFMWATGSLAFLNMKGRQSW